MSENKPAAEALQPAASGARAATVSETDKNPAKPELSEKELAVLERLSDISKNAMSYLQSHVLSNGAFLEQLQKRKKIFTLNAEKRGTWFIVFNPASALRFIHAIDERLPRYMLHTSVKHDDPSVKEVGKKSIFDWSCVFFLSADNIANCIQARNLVYGSLKEGEAPTPAQRAVLDKLLSGFPMLKSMTSSQFTAMFDTVDQYKPDTQLAITSMMCYPEKELVGAESYLVDVPIVMSKPHAHLHRLAFQHYFESAVCSTAAMHALPSAHQLAMLRYVPYSYATATMKLSGKIELTGHIAEPSRLREAMHCTNMQCGRCYKTNATVRCPRCHLFVYCNETCREEHFNNGAKVVGTGGEADAVAAVPHSLNCSMIRSAVRMWGQIPPNMDTQTFSDIATDADEKVREAYSVYSKEQEEEEEKNAK